MPLNKEQLWQVMKAAALLDPDLRDNFPTRSRQQARGRFAAEQPRA
jgi:hypothetical protein